LEALEKSLPSESEPWEVIITETVVGPGPDGRPIPTGTTIISKWVDGELVEREEIKEDPS
jgi:hypothetical protein